MNCLLFRQIENELYAAYSKPLKIERSASENLTRLQELEAKDTLYTCHMPFSLRFLDFDLSENACGLCTWSALASPLAAHSTALLTEVQGLLDDLTQHLGPAGPLDNGHDWDMALDTETDHGRTTVSLHLTGGAPLADRLTLWMNTP